jgi:hypothetical protein
VGGFLGPRLLGFSALPVPGQSLGGSTLPWAAAGLTIFISVPIEYGLDLGWMAVLRAAVVTAVVVPTLQLWRAPAVRTTLSWTVWIACWVIVVGVWHVALAPRYRVDLLHMLFVGGFSLLILAVATRVTLSHGGKDLRLERRSWPLRIGLTLGLIAMLARIGAPFAAASYFEHLAFAALLWIAGVLCWGSAMARRLAGGRPGWRGPFSPGSSALAMCHSASVSCRFSTRPRTVARIVLPPSLLSSVKVP